MKKTQYTSPSVACMKMCLGNELAAGSVAASYNGSYNAIEFDSEIAGSDDTSDSRGFSLLWD